MTTGKLTTEFREMTLDDSAWKEFSLLFLMGITKMYLETNARTA